MLEQINTHLKSSRYLMENSNYLGLKRELWPKVSGDLYPLAHDYYHNLNPFFGFNAVNFDFFKTFPAVTLRDGGFPLACFYTQKFPRLLNSEQTILVHKDCEHFVPGQLKNKTLSYKMVQPRRIKIEEAKQIIIVGVLSDQMILDKEKIEKKLEILASCSNDAKIKIFLQTRKNPFDLTYSEPQLTSPLTFSLFKKLKTTPEFLTTHKLMGLSFLKDSYVINLSTDNYIISDSFTDFLLSSKGATIHEWDTPSDTDSLLNVNVSLFHHMEVNQIKKESIFNELIFMKKSSIVSDPLYDPYLFANFKRVF